MPTYQVDVTTADNIRGDRLTVTADNADAARTAGESFIAEHPALGYTHVHVTEQEPA